MANKREKGSLQVTEPSKEEWTDLTDGELWGGLLISVFGGLGLGSYRFHEESDQETQIQRLAQRRARARHNHLKPRNESMRGDIWRFKHITARPSQHGRKK